MQNWKQQLCLQSPRRISGHIFGANIPQKGRGSVDADAELEAAPASTEPQRKIWSCILDRYSSEGRGSVDADAELETATVSTAPQNNDWPCILDSYCSVGKGRGRYRCGTGNSICVYSTPEENLAMHLGQIFLCRGGCCRRRCGTGIRKD